MTRLAACVLLSVVLGLGLAATPTFAADEAFPLRDGDTWVMIGDSITAQHLHSNYFEAFCFARYPKLTFRFRNSGVSGDTIPKALARFDWDAAPWKPTVVSVELGMNDQGGFTVDQFTTNMTELVSRIRGITARPVLLTASPINNGNTSENYAGNTRLHDYAVSLKKLAADQKVPYADQFHALIDIWGRNKPREQVANAIVLLKQVPLDNTALEIPGVEQLKAFLAAQQQPPRPLVSMQGDPVHPGPPGQMMMAAALLKELGAEGFVSSAALTAQGQVTDAKGCVVDNVQAANNGLSFDRLDDSLPFPLVDDTRSVVPLFPTILDLSRYTLLVTGLTGDKYTLKINGQATAELTAKELAAGVNLTTFAQGPIAAQARGVLNAVAAKEGAVGEWRGVSRQLSMAATPELTQRLKDVQQRVEAADQKIREAAKPAKLHFEIVPAAK